MHDTNQPTFTLARRPTHAILMARLLIAALDDNGDAFRVTVEAQVADIPTAPGKTEGRAKGDGRSSVRTHKPRTELEEHRLVATYLATSRTGLQADYAPGTYCEGW